jgi:AraC-like DNA-binding protein
MSRSAFAARFAELAGEPAMHYVTRWRMHLATVALRGGAGAGELARRLGYESEAAFSRAYKRVVGVPPAATARQRGTPVAAGAPRGELIARP